MEETAVAVVRVSWGESSSRLNTALLLSWGIHIGSGGNLIGTLIGVVTLHSTLKTSNLRLVFCYHGNSIASSSGCNIVVVVVIVLGSCTVEIARVAGVVVVVSSGLHISSAMVGVAWTRHWGSIVPRGISGRRVGTILLGIVGPSLMHHSTLEVVI